MPRVMYSRDVIDPVSRSVLDPHFRHAVTNRSHVTEMSIFGCQQSGDDTGHRAAVPQPAQPPIERSASQDREHVCIVLYGIPYNT